MGGNAFVCNGCVSSLIVLWVYMVFLLVAEMACVSGCDMCASSWLWFGILGASLWGLALALSMGLLPMLVCL